MANTRHKPLVMPLPKRIPTKKLDNALGRIEQGIKQLRRLLRMKKSIG